MGTVCCSTGYWVLIEMVGYITLIFHMQTHHNGYSQASLKNMCIYYKLNYHIESRQIQLHEIKGYPKIKNNNRIRMP